VNDVDSVGKLELEFVGGEDMQPHSPMADKVYPRSCVVIALFNLVRD